MYFTFEHFMWLQPSFFWMGDLQLGQGLELVTSHRQLAAVLVSSSVPLTGEDKKTQNFYQLVGMVVVYSFTFHSKILHSFKKGNNSSEGL